MRPEPPRSGVRWFCSRPTKAAWSGLTDADRDRRIQANGVAGLDTLRDACQEMDVRMIACEAGLRAEAIDPEQLMPNTEVSGIVTFLSAVGTGQIITI